LNEPFAPQFLISNIPEKSSLKIKERFSKSKEGDKII